MVQAVYAIVRGATTHRGRLDLVTIGRTAIRISSLITQQSVLTGFQRDPTMDNNPAEP